MSDKNLPPQPHKESLARRGVKALLPEAGWDMIKESWRAFRESPYYTPFIVGVGSMAGTVATAILNRLQGLPPDLLGILIIATMWVLLLSAVFAFGRLKRRSAVAPNVLKSSTTMTAEVIEPEYAKTVQALEGRIKELQRELEEETKKYKSELSQKEGLKELRDSLESRWKGYLFQYGWLFQKVEAQGQSISSYVEVKKVYFCRQELETPMLNSVFGIDFLNKSVFDISIEDKVGGYIEFEGTKLEATPLIISNPGTVGLGGEGTITIEQRLSRPEADLIASKDPKYAEFNLTNLIINIKGERFAPSELHSLKIPKRLHADPQVEIALLKSEIVAQKESNDVNLSRINKERQTAEGQIWQRIEIVDKLSKVMGYGDAIEARRSIENMEYPKPEMDEWAKQLWKNLALCFGESDIEKFYAHIDPHCPGYERGAVRVIQVPELNAERNLWFFYHRLRLSELIREQHHSPLAVRKSENQA